MDFPKDLFLTLSRVGVAIAKPGDFSLSDTPSASASWIRDLLNLWLHAALPSATGLEVSPHQVFVPQGLLPHLQCMDSAISAALLCTELRAGCIWGRC